MFARLDAHAGRHAQGAPRGRREAIRRWGSAPCGRRRRSRRPAATRRPSRAPPGLLRRAPGRRSGAAACSCSTPRARDVDAGARRPEARPRMDGDRTRPSGPGEPHTRAGAQDRSPRGAAGRRGSRCPHADGAGRAARRGGPPRAGSTRPRAPRAGLTGEPSRRLIGGSPCHPRPRRRGGRAIRRRAVPVPCAPVCPAGDIRTVGAAVASSSAPGRGASSARSPCGRGCGAADPRQGLREAEPFVPDLRTSRRPRPPARRRPPPPRRRARRARRRGRRW